MDNSSQAMQESQVRKVVEDWAQGVRNGDREALVAHHTNDHVMFDVIPPIKINGLEAYKAQWELFFRESPGGDGSFDLHELQIFAGEAVAFCHCLVSISPGQAPSIRLTIGLQKIAGQWYIAHEHHSGLEEAN